MCSIVGYFYSSLVFWLALRARQNTAWLVKISHDTIACVASVSNRVIAQKLEQEQKKKRRGKGEGRRGNACSQTPRFLQNAPWYLMVPFICKFTARQDRSQYNSPRGRRFYLLARPCSLPPKTPFPFLFKRLPRRLPIKRTDYCKIYFVP